MPWYLGNSKQVMPMGLMSFDFGWVFLTVFIWSIFWKGLSLWHAARRNEKGWFIIFLVINTVGILELVYLLWKVRIFQKEQVSAKVTQKRKITKAL